MSDFAAFVKALGDAWLMTCEIPEDEQPEGTSHLRWKIEQFVDTHMPGYLDDEVLKLVSRNQVATLFDEVAS